MLKVGELIIDESASNIMHSVAADDSDGLPSVEANFCGVIIEHEGQNVVHVPAEVTEDVPWATQALEETA
jgi:hypothetical protein